MSEQALIVPLVEPTNLQTRFERAQHWLAEALRVDDVLGVRNEAEQLKLLGRQAQDKTLQANAVELQMRSERRLGGLIIEAKAAGQIVANRVKSVPGGNTSVVRLEEAGISRKLSSKAQSLAKSPEAIFEDVVRQSREKILAGKPVTINAMRDVTKREKQIRRAVKEAQLGARARALPTDVFQLILEDPEWKFETFSENGLDRGAENHYPTSDLATIKARQVSLLAADDCVYFLWATVPMLPQALELMRYRGFEYKSHFVWDKVEPGTGYWNRNQHELLLVGTKGRVPAPAMGTQFPSLVTSRKGVHSEKPDWAYELIEAYFPTLKKIELNARRTRAGWARWGNEAPEDEIEAAVLRTPDARVSDAAGREDAGTSASEGGEGIGPDLPATHSTEPETGAPGVALADPPRSEAAPHEDAVTSAPAGGDGGNPDVLPAVTLTTSPPLSSMPPATREAVLAVAAAAAEAINAPDEPAIAEVATDLAASAPLKPNDIIRAGYARNAPLAELSAATGLTVNAVQQRAKRMKLGDPARQSIAVAASNRRRGAAELTAEEGVLQ